MAKYLKTVLKFLLKIAISTFLIYMLYTNVDLKVVVGSIARLNWPLFAAAVILNYFGSITTQSLITKMTSRDMRSTIIGLDAVNLGMRFYAMIMPMAVVSVIRWRRYTQLGCSKTHALLLMLLNKALQILLIAVFIIFGITVYFKLFIERLGLSTSVILLIISVIMACISLAISLVLMNQVSLNRLIYLIYSFRSGKPLIYKKYIFRTLRNIRRTIKDSQSIECNTVIRVVFYSFVSYMLIIISQYILINAIHIEVSFIAIAFARSLVQFLLMLPISAAGIGLREAGFVAGLSIFGVPTEYCMALALLLLLVQSLYSIIGALIEGVLLWKAS